MSRSLRVVLAEAAARLAAAGVPDPARDARLLAAHALRVAPDRLILMMDEVPGPAAEGRLRDALDARAWRQPVSQIVGGRMFWNHWFAVTPDVLDPRPETEILIAAALEAPFARVLDLGTGSGAILLTLLAERPAASGLGIDISEAALAVARANAAALGVQGRVGFGVSNWFGAVSGVFDLIVSNPPYLAEDEIATLEPEPRDWEPRIALTPGGDGLDAYRAIAAGAPAHLAPGGRLMVEIGPTQGGPVMALFRDAGLQDVAVLPDLDGRHRVVHARAPGAGGRS